MFTQKTTRIRSTTIYIVLSVCALFAGITAILWGGADVPGPLDSVGKPLLLAQRSPSWFSIGTSLFAAGVVSLGFAILRLFDDLDSVKLHEKLDALLKNLGEAQEGFKGATIHIQDASKRCLFDSQVSDKFKGAICSHQPLADVSIDVIGLKLSRFLNDQFDCLRSESKGRKITVRMLMQEPDGENFRAMCKQEARDENATRSDTQKTLTSLSGARQNDDSLEYRAGNLTILVRFLSECQPITYFRVGETILVRPRIRPSGAGQRFYEVYCEKEGKAYFSLFKDYFDDNWKTAKFKLPTSMSAALKTSFQSR